MSTVEENRATLQRWYDKMWGECNFSLVPDIAAPQYLRHDITGANRLMTSQEYSDMIALGLDGQAVTHFTYFLVAEGDYVASLGRYILKEGRQWDWVQLFRLEDAAMVETWLPGMGGTDLLGYPQPHNVWTGTEVPAPLPMTARKQLVQDFYQQVFVANQPGKAGHYLAPEVRVHDNIGRDDRLSPQGYYERMAGQVDGDTITDFKLFMIEEGDMVVAVGSWRIDGERQWDWVQAFHIAGDRIVRAWMPAIGGDDTSLQHGPGTAWGRECMPAASTLIGADI